MITLGDKVRDTITGFEGIAVCRLIYLQGCDRIAVQPPVDKEGRCPEAGHFDEPQLEIVEPVKTKKEILKQDNGGPDKYLDKGRVKNIEK
jgi:hypothetical protein